MIDFLIPRAHEEKLRELVRKREAAKLKRELWTKAEAEADKAVLEALLEAV